MASSNAVANVRGARISGGASGMAPLRRVVPCSRFLSPTPNVKSS
jgi:hypothetical protein